MLNKRGTAVFLVGLLAMGCVAASYEKEVERLCLLGKKIAKSKEEPLKKMDTVHKRFAPKSEQGRLTLQAVMAQEPRNAMNIWMTPIDGKNRPPCAKLAEIYEAADLPWALAQVEKEKSPRAYAILGHAYEHVGKVDEALKVFNQLVKTDPNYRLGWQGLGGCYEKKGDLDQAATHYRKACELVSAEKKVSKFKLVSGKAPKPFACNWLSEHGFDQEGDKTK